MVDEEAAANASSRMNLDSSGESAELREEATEKAKPMPPEEMGQAMSPQSVKSWIATEDFPGTPRRWVFGKGDSNVLS